MKEGWRGRVQNFPKTQQTLVEYLHQEPCGSSAVDVENFMGLLETDQETLFEEFEQLSQRVDELKVPRDKSSQRVRKGWNILQNFFETKSSTINSEGVNVMTYGSILYDDPRNLDYDILLVTEHFRDEVNEVHHDWQKELDEAWDVGTPGHLSYLPMVRLKHHCKAFDEGWEKYVRNRDWEIDLDFGNTTIMMTGEVIKSPKSDTTNIKGLRNQVMQLAKDSPTLLASMVFSLQKVVIIRELRRSGLDHV